MSQDLRDIRAKKEAELRRQNQADGKPSWITIAYQRGNTFTNFWRIRCERCNAKRDFSVRIGDEVIWPPTFLEAHANCGQKFRKPMQSKPKPAHTKEEDLHLTKKTALGCICCRLDGRGWVAAGIHHIREGEGMGQRASHFDTLPLCEPHHQGELSPRHPERLAFHKDQTAWRAKYGSEADLVDQLNALIERLDAKMPNWWEFGHEVLAEVEGS